MISVQAGYGGPVRVLPGPRLLAGVMAGPGLAAHRERWPHPGPVQASRLSDLLQQVDVPGRGGAGFPFGRKVATALRSGRRRELVVNAAESEPGSAKDSALLVCAPHLVLDGAELVADALGVRTIRVVLPGSRPLVRQALEAALAERPGRAGHRGRAGRYELYETAGGFVGGQESAVLQLIEGRPNIPVTSWQPAAVAGLHARPTVLANAETFAQTAVLHRTEPREYRRLGTGSEPGTTLLTVAGDTADATVVEVPYGIGLVDVLTGVLPGGFDDRVPLLVGGFHGCWLAPGQAGRLSVSRTALAAAGLTLGAGVLLPLPAGRCPVERTARIAGYLAGQSAGQCGPCRFGLPALAAELARLCAPFDPSATADPRRATSPEHAVQLADLVRGRGACAHPDGTARLVTSLLSAFPDEVEAHRWGGCLTSARVVPELARSRSRQVVP